MNTETTRINREACAWIAKLHGAELSPQERIRLQRWLRQSAQHSAELRRMARRWEELNVLTELAVPVETPGLWQLLKGASGLNPFRHIAVFGAFAAAAVLVFAVVLWPQLNTAGGAPSASAYATAIGEQRLVTLSDGSTILMNTDSQVSVDYTRDYRTVHLIRGEAHFDVSPQPHRPFRVFAGRGLVRAVGTAFSVYLKEDTVEVTVTKGQVEIDAIQSAAGSAAPAPAQKQKLAVISAGQSAIFDQVVKSVEMVKLEEIPHKLSWHEGLVKFAGAPLEEVVEEISRYTPVSIEILDPELKSLRIGGFFRVGETNKMFEALEASFGVSVEHVDENLVHLSAKTDRR